MKKFFIFSLLFAAICGYSAPSRKISFATVLQTRKYILALQKIPELKNTEKKEVSIINNARIGEALGFLTENVENQDKLIQLFPNGISNIEKLMDGLRTKTLLAPYGEYNNNYLTTDKSRLIYSDDSDLAAVTYQVMKKMNASALTHPRQFANALANALCNHWIKMRDSGDYGKDGLYYGKRGYSKLVLHALSDLAKKDRQKPDWYIATDNYLNNLDNGSLLRAWIIGLDNRLTPQQAFKLAAIQSYITHPNYNIVISAGALAFVMNKLMAHQYSNKKQVLNEMINVIARNADSSSNAISHLKLGIAMAESRNDPILVYNQIRGIQYDDFLALIAYSFLYFQSYSEALLYIVHTPGDNDSVAFVTGALFAAYTGRSVDPGYLRYIEPWQSKTIS